ncbi:MAG: hypothetical protein PHD67_09495 [Oscillospiraceae bacterium]|nr:hypothetical protein [Oscillospiraceae bacterium]
MKFGQGGVKVVLSPLFLAGVGLFLLADGAGLGGRTLLAAALHELGHLTAMAAVGQAPKEIVFSGFEVKITRRRAGMGSPWREAAVYGAGPAVNLIFGAVALAMGRRESALAHLGLGAFSLLPAGGLDGGRLVRLMLECFCPGAAARRAFAALSAAVGASLLAAGIWAGSGLGRLSLAAAGVWICRDAWKGRTGG